MSFSVILFQYFIYSIILLKWIRETGMKLSSFASSLCILFIIKDDDDSGSTDQTGTAEPLSKDLNLYLFSSDVGRYGGNQCMHVPFLLTETCI